MREGNFIGVDTNEAGALKENDIVSTRELGTQWNSLILIQRSPAGSERGLPFARDGIRTSRADAWNQDWEYISRVRYPTQGFEDIVIILAFDEISSFLLHYPDCVWISSNDDILKPLCGITDGGDILR